MCTENDICGTLRDLAGLAALCSDAKRLREMSRMVRASPRLQKDVDMNEEAEMQRLEHRLPHSEIPTNIQTIRFFSKSPEKDGAMLLFSTGV